MPSPKRKSPSPTRPAHLMFNVLNRLSGQNLAKLSGTNRTARAIIKGDPRLQQKIVRAKMARVLRNMGARRTAYFRCPFRTCHNHLYPNTVRAAAVHGLRRTGRVITPVRAHPRNNLYGNNYYQ